MSTDLGPGTPLIFIGPELAHKPSGLTLEALYFVAGMRPNETCGRTYITLRGSPGNWEWYCICAFRPLGGEEDEVIEKEELVDA
jgi:hypothetical protein